MTDDKNHVILLKHNLVIKKFALEVTNKDIED